MSESSFKNNCSELRFGSNFAYILSENRLFSATEYKVLSSQTGGIFLRCMKMSYNGKVQCYYLTENKQPLLSMLSALSCDGLVTVILNILDAVLDVRNNGFLSCNNIDISAEHFYVEPSNLKVSVVYVPMERESNESYFFETKLRSSLLNLIEKHLKQPNQTLLRLTGMLSDASVLLSEIRDKLLQEVKPQPAPLMKGIAKIISVNTPFACEIQLTKQSFILGKEASSVDGAITFNAMISRVHCKITEDTGRYWITDLNSKNGTFVNKRRLPPNQTFPIQSGDMIRLANTDFQFLIT